MMSWMRNNPKGSISVATRKTIGQPQTMNDSPGMTAGGGSPNDSVDTTPRPMAARPVSARGVRVVSTAAPQRSLYRKMMPRARKMF